LSKIAKIVLTGGPGGGKTTAADLFLRELQDHVIVVPEAATMLYSGGFLRCDTPDTLIPTQNAIFHVQKNIERLYQAHYDPRVMICDRGSVDGAAYWPEGQGEFFEAMGTTYEKELESYSGVVFFETAAQGGHTIKGGNIYRTEDDRTALDIDDRLRKLWEKHPNFYFVPHQSSFIDKIMDGLESMQKLINYLISRP
jgi:predicted ATPase